MLLEKYRAIDLTHTLHATIPTWNGSCGFCLEVKKDYDQLFKVQKIKMHAGVGTHMDAPAHRFAEGCSIADIPLDQLILQGVKIDLCAKAEANYLISRQDLEEFEANHGQIPAKSLVLLQTGWNRFWSEPTKYRNEDAQGEMHFPSLSKEGAEFLLQRDVAGIAIDTLSPDRSDSDFPVHRILLGAGKYIIENLADCSMLPAIGFTLLALPLKAEEGTEAPLRLVALVPRN